MKLIAGGSGIRPGRLEKSSKINSRGPPSIPYSRVLYVRLDKFLTMHFTRSGERKDAIF